MRPLSTALLVLLATACAPKGDENPAVDSVPAASAVVDTPRTDTATSAATVGSGIVVPAPAGAREPAPAAGSTGASKGANTRAPRGDTASSRIKPPTKAPGGFIVVPRSAHDSLRMAPPSTGTSTRP